MVNFATDELRLVAEKRGIKNYQSMSRKRLLSTLDKSECNFKNISLKALNQIAKMQNLSQNELAQMIRMKNLPQNELEQITKMRRIKNYRNMSKERLLIALLKSKQRHAELYKSKSNNTEIEETRKIFNEIRNKFSKSKIKENRKKLYEIERGLESEEEQKRKQHAEELRALKNSLEESREEIKRKYYRPIRTKGAFNDNYVEYESKRDKDKNLTPEDYLDIIRSFLKDIINNHKNQEEWKIQLTMQITFISSLDTGEFRVMHSKSNNVEIMMGTETDDIINELF